MRHSPRRLLLLASALALAAVALVPTGVASAAPDYRVLVFWGGEEKSATTQAGFRAIQDLGREHNFAVEATDDPTRFVDHQLSRFRTVVFLSQHRGSLGNGDWIALNGPFNLLDINSLAFRVASTSTQVPAGNPMAAVEVHLDRRGRADSHHRDAHVDRRHRGMAEPDRPDQ